MRLRALEISQKDIKFYLCSFRAKDIVGIYKVDTWRTDNRDGYQRDVIVSRARGFVLRYPCKKHKQEIYSFDIFFYILGICIL